MSNAGKFNINLTINGYDGNNKRIDFELIRSITGATRAIEGNMSVGTSAEQAVTTFNTTQAGGVMTDIKFAVIDNTDSAYPLRVRSSKTSADTVDMEIAAGCFHIFNSRKQSVSADASPWSTYANMDTLLLKATGGTAEIRYLLIN